MKDNNHRQDMEPPGYTKIQLATYNHIGEFFFYISPAQFQEYLTEKAIHLTIEEFLRMYTLNDSRFIYDWLRAKNTVSPVEENQED